MGDFKKTVGSNLALIKELTTLILMLLLIFILGRQGYVSELNREQSAQILKELKSINSSIKNMQKQLPSQQRVKSVPSFALSQRNRKSSNKDPSFFKVSLTGAHWIGDESAPITMIEYVNYQCVFCKKFHVESFPALKSEFFDKNLVRLVVKDLVNEGNPESLRISNAVHCAAAQGKFAGMHEEMLLNPQSLVNNELSSIAKKIGLNETLFTQCINEETYTEAIKQSSAEIKKMGIANTPTFVIGTFDGQELQGQKIEGARPFAFFKNKIELFLSNR